MTPKLTTWKATTGLNCCYCYNNNNAYTPAVVTIVPSTGLKYHDDLCLPHFLYRLGLFLREVTE